MLSPSAQERGSSANTLGRCKEEGRRRDPPESPRPPIHHHPARRDAHRLGPSPSRTVGGGLRGARAFPYSNGSSPVTRRPRRAIEQGACLGARRDRMQVSRTAAGKGASGGQGAQRPRSVGGVRGQPGSRRRPCRCPRTRRSSVRGQGVARGCTHGRGRGSRSTRVPLAAANSCPTRSEHSSWMTSGCATTSAGTRSTPDSPCSPAGTAQQALRPDGASALC